MKRFLSAVILCIGLLFAVSLNFLLPQTEAQSNILQDLLDLPAPPPPNPLFSVRDFSNRTVEFYSKKKIPADDSPIEDLLDYWRVQSSNYQELGYNLKPSKKSLERILSEVKEKPETLPQYINSFPRNEDTVEFVKKLYDKYQAEESEEIDESWKESVRNWLKFNSKYFSDELLEFANQVEDTAEYVTNQDELLALSRVDWDKARPVVERLYNDKSKKTSQVLAIWAFYVHALEEDSIDVSRYRDELKAIVEDKNALPGMRDLALDALVKEKEWDGRDEWYLSLLSDETLGELKIDGRVFTGLTTIIYHSPPDRFVEKMLELLKSDNPTVRTAAIRNLSLMVSPENIEVVRALLPWLLDAKWAKETGSERRALVEALKEIEMPESVPGLIHLLNEKSTVTIFSNSNTAANVMMNKLVPIPTPTNANTQVIRTEEVFQYRREAIEALATQKDARAVPALRAVLPQVEFWERYQIVRTMLLSRGFSVAEQIDALETYYKISLTNANSNTTSNIYPSNYAGNYYPSNRSFDPADIKSVLGSILVSHPEPDRDLVRALAARISELKRKDPQLANILRDTVKKWNGAAVYTLFLEDLKNKQADLDQIVKLLGVRKVLREKQSEEVFAVRGSNPSADAIAACILESPNDYEGILSGENTEAKIALLGCARLIRAPLSIEKVAALMKSADKMLATAAELWLESEDSAEARQIILANNPNKAKILGARTMFKSDVETEVSSDFVPILFNSIEGASQFPYYNYFIDTYLETTEKRLQKEVLESKDLLGIYAYHRNFIRLFKDKIIYSWEEDDARYRLREMSKDEFDEFRNYLSAQNVDSLKPFLSLCYDCEDKELLMLGAAGGRRVFVRADSSPPFFAGLDKFFGEMQKQPSKLHYYLEKDIAGLDILFTDKNLQATTLWKSGADFRVLIFDKARQEKVQEELEEQYEKDLERDDIDYQKLEAEHEKRRKQREFEHLSWRVFSGETLGDLTSSPTPNDAIPVRDGFPVQASTQQWKARAATVEVREGEDSLIKIVSGRAAKLADGYYISPVVTANGRWAIATKYSDEDADRVSLVRINLATNKEFKIKVEDAPYLKAVVFLPSVNKVLLSYGNYYDREVDPFGDFFLLDADTGAVQPAKGDFRPIIQQTFRPLQPTGTADEFYAAIPDLEKSETEIGIYNAKTFTFKPLLKVPQIKFDSMAMWVEGGKIYFTYQGHLLSLPMPKQS